MTTLILYHGNCADGFSAAWSAYKALGDFAHYVPCFHNKPLPINLDEQYFDTVYMLDFSYKKPVIEEILSKVGELIVLDHHKTAEAELKSLFESKRIDGEFDMSRSGAMMAWQYFHPHEPIPNLIRIVQDRDLFQFKIPFSREISANIFSYEYTFQNWDMLAAACENPNEFAELVIDGRAIDRNHQKNVLELLKETKRKMVIGGHDVLVSNLPYTLASDGANTIAATENCAFGACYYDSPTGRVFSLRSKKGGIDVSEIAKQYGGGGHYHAAGFTATIGWEGDRVSYSNAEQTLTEYVASRYW